MTTPTTNSKYSARPKDWSLITIGIAMIVLGSIIFEDTMTTVFTFAGLAMMICGFTGMKAFGSREDVKRLREGK